MKPIELWKMSGSGNDFILIDNRNGQIKDKEIGRLVKRIRRRRESVDADGVIFVTGFIARSLVASVHGMANSPVKTKTKGGEDLTIHFQRKAELFEKSGLRATLRSCTRATS